MVVGKIVAAHGLRGQVRVEPATDFFGRFAKGERLLLRGEWRTVETFSVHKNRPLIKLSGVDSIEAAQALQWETLSQEDDSAPPLEDGEFFVSELVGMAVRLPDGTELGPVDEVLSSAAHEILRMGEVMIPFVDAFIASVDEESRVIVVTPIPGMLPGTE